MDTTFHVYKRLDIFDRAEIADARMKYEWGKGYRDYRSEDRKFWTTFNDLMQLRTMGFRPDELIHKINLLTSLHLVKKFFQNTQLMEDQKLSDDLPF